MHRLVYLMKFFPNFEINYTFILLPKFLNDFEHIGVSIRNTVGDVNLIIFFISLYIKAESPVFKRPWIRRNLLKVEKASKPDLFFGVGDIESILSPDISLFLKGLHIGPHTSRIETEPPLKVTNIKAIFLISWQPSNNKIKPIKMSPRIGVDSHKKIVLITVDLFYHKYTWTARSRLPD